MHAICLPIGLSLTSSRNLDCASLWLLVICSIKFAGDDKAFTAEDCAFSWLMIICSIKFAWDDKALIAEDLKPLIFGLNADHSNWLWASALVPCSQWDGIILAWSGLALDFPTCNASPRPRCEFNAQVSYMLAMHCYTGHVLRLTSKVFLMKH